MDLAAVRDLDRPDSKLMTLYFLRSLVFPPLSLLALPFYYFRYHSMRYVFDEQGVTMSWGVLFRKEISLSYARIQDIHLTSGLFQRWVGLADIHIQTASGSAKAEMTIEGLLEFEVVRDFLYSKMRGSSKEQVSSPSAVPARADSHLLAATAPGFDPADQSELVAALREVSAELRATRQAVERASLGTSAVGGTAEAGAPS